MQGEFTQLLIEEEESVTWQSIVRGLPRNIMSFCVKLASNALPSPDNLRRWGKRVMATCPLCSCPNGTLAHIINFCPVALNQGRYMYTPGATTLSSTSSTARSNLLLPVMLKFSVTYQVIWSTTL